MTWPACGTETAEPEPGPELLPRRGRDGSFSLYSVACDEGFHSAAGALREANEKFVVPAALERFVPGRELVVAEVAVGTGTNTAALLDAATTAGLGLDWWGLELDHRPLALALADAGFRAQWSAAVIGRLEGLSDGPRLWLGDARRRLPELLETLAGRCDLVLLDAFSPTRCPELWSREFLGQLVRLLRPEGRLLTYSSAAAVRRCLLELGLEVRAIRPPADEPERWSAGTAASFTPLAPHPALRPLEPFEREHLASRAGIAYRDPSGSATAAEILERRRREQERSAAPPGRLPRRPGRGGLGHSGGHR
ncbi:MnmC family methyltransferase [Cyanobium sp. N5-Cardenillas]|uniref:MnmC family methyltransferase n=1 Tax=Cyanobium sp. N5-Cardenillas TaxID=2823720 RepID=UPI0020CCFEB6|nr:MnmC family methyltransferase [Cyanobium sp. N5-Cardenillas]MCP9785799.1 SAM-dependent methyltransferase [Cyanobium sp. N5-Cardenillas]